MIEMYKYMAAKSRKVSNVFVEVVGRQFDGRQLLLRH